MIKLKYINHFGLSLLFLWLTTSLSAQVLPYGNSTVLSGGASNQLKTQPTIASDDDQNWIAVWGSQTFSNTGSTKGINIATSPRIGKEWETVRTIFATNQLTQPKIATNGTGLWVLTWRDGVIIQSTISTDNGQTWSIPVILNNPDNIRGISEPAIAADNGTEIRIVWSEQTATGYSVKSSRSTNSGQSWTMGNIATFDKAASKIVKIPKVCIAVNQTGNWVATWVDNRLNGTSLLKDRLSYAIAQTGNWSGASIMHQCEYIRSISIASHKENNKWMMVWEEEDADQPANRRNFIYHALSEDDARSWKVRNNPIRQGKNPIIKHVANKQWALVASSSQLIANTGTDEDIVLTNTDNDGGTWGNNQLINAYGTEDSNNGWTDAFPVMENNQHGAWVMLWMKNFVNEQGQQSEINYSLADNSPPIAGEITSREGAIDSENQLSTTQSTALSFDWENSIDNQSGVFTYEFAFGTPDNLEAYESFQLMDINLRAKKFLPSSYAATFKDGYFTRGAYVFTIRTTNLVGMKTTKSITVNVRPVKVGEQIPLPDGKVWDDIDWTATKNSFSPANHLILLEAEAQLIAADYSDGSSTSINWHFKTGTPNRRLIQYSVQSLPIKEPMTIYHTHLENNVDLTKAPSVNVALLNEIIIHYNTTVPERTGDDKAFWRTGSELFAARNQTTNPLGKPAYIILELRNSTGFIGFEIVEIKPDIPEVDPAIVDIGSRLLPFYRDPQSNGVAPFVAVNQSDANGQTSIYQHLVTDSRNHGELWAIRQNTNNERMRVYWKRRGLGEIEWPYEIRLYAAPNWPVNNPEKYQLYVRGTNADELGPNVFIPNNLNPEMMDFQSPAGHARLEVNEFTTDGVGFSLLKLQEGPPGRPGLDWVGFEVVRSVSHRDEAIFDLTAKNWNIGEEIADDYHEGPKPGYIHVSAGNRFAPDIYKETGQIFPVNLGNFEVWWSNLSRTIDPEGPSYPAWPTERIQWPSKVSKYQSRWYTASWQATPANQIIIAKQEGTSTALNPATFGKYKTDWDLYIQNNEDLAGFNPNDEHALVFPFGDGNAVFPLRDDLGSATTSEPYVLVQYKEQPTKEKYQFRVFKVLRESADFPFKDWPAHPLGIDKYEVEAGKLIQRPFPLSLLPNCEQNEAVSGPFFVDKNNNFYAKSAGDDGETASMILRYHYPIQDNFYVGIMDEVAPGDHVPWLDNGTGNPVDIQYTIHWPLEVPTMKIGQTIIEPQLGLPGLNGQCSVDMIYDQSVAQGKGRSILLIDPIQTRSVVLEAIPSDIKTEASGMEQVFTDLSLALRSRVGYTDAPTKELFFRGVLEDPEYAFLNVMSNREKEELLALSGDAAWQTAVNKLYDKVKTPIIIENSNEDAFDLLAYTTGLGEGIGYVTFVMQNGDNCGADPISLEIIEVIPELESNEIIVIKPSCPFDETLTLRYKGDFGGNTDAFKFEWRYLPDQEGYSTVPYEDWIPFKMMPESGEGAVDITIKGPGLLTLSDNRIVARYTTPDGDQAWANTTSDWTKPKLAEGWIKRVIGDINPFEQRATGGGIEGAENKFASFADREVNTIVSMISQAGERWTGNVPLNCDKIDDFGLIEIYETILGRGVDLSIEGIPPVDYTPANDALLLVASRIADMYTLLGNEAYADATDPTIAFSTEDGEFGTEASSIFSFQNQTPNLLEEELALLRGKDDLNSVENHPAYNRLLWNFSGDKGEVAYKENYNLSDQNGDISINEVDAKALFPQAHGDAWGHYLTATKTYYKLLRHPNYTWTARSESVELGGVDITVDFFDERKFVTAAAAKARTGAEIVNLTYRQAYIENADEQSRAKGYKDTDEERAWGFDEWSERTGQGAYFDWIVGNAILPPVETEKTGIQKIDRTTVLELRDLANRAVELQTKVDEANDGLNPLGIANDVVPFDISPAAIDEGKTHFEQIYDRAIISMNNAVRIFNHAKNSTELLRRQADDLANFQIAVDDQEAGFNSSLIEIYGYPYPDDIGPGKTYPTGYDGPDIYHYNYVDPADLLLETPPNQIEVPVFFKELAVDENGALKESTKEVIYHLSNNAEQFGQIKPASWTGNRRAPGELQQIRSDLIQTKSRLDQAILSYDNLIQGIEDQMTILVALNDLNANEIKVLNAQLNEQETLLDKISASKGRQLGFAAGSRAATLIADALAEFLPKSVGFSTDVTAPGRGAIRLAGAILSEGLNVAADQEELAQLDHANALEISNAKTNIALTTLNQSQAVLEQLKVIEDMVRQEAIIRLEIYALLETTRQIGGSYLTTLAEGQRLLEDRNCFRQQTATNIQSRRYKDMAFRIFRNDALQKYRSQFDLAARYVYLAAKAYDYETTLLIDDNKAVTPLLTDIVRQRAIGEMDENGQPTAESGLAKPLSLLAINFASLKSSLGINNPQREENSFSLRRELFRIPEGEVGNEQWQDTLRSYLVDNVQDLPEFQRYCRPFNIPQAVEPAIVIPFDTDITFGLNFFGKESIGGDSSYDPTHFSTKIRSLGTVFENYNENSMSRTPRVYLIPVGLDIQRSPTGAFGDIRTFKVQDQVVPTPFSSISNSDLNNRLWIPAIDNLQDKVAVRRFPAFRAYYDGVNTNESISTFNGDSRLIGRSVWNTRWLLIIPAGTLLINRQEGIDRFISGEGVGTERDGNGVSDIKLFFETYAYPGL